MIRDDKNVGEISNPPYFWGPYNEFQQIDKKGFDSKEWSLHSKNLHQIFLKRKKKHYLLEKTLRAIKILIGRESSGLFPKRVEKLISKGAKLLDIGGGWGDNYCRLVLGGIIIPKSESYFVLDNEIQAKFGENIFKENEIKFLSLIPSGKFEIVFLIGTLQYIENWKSVFDTFEKLNSEVVYIARTPFVSNHPSYVVVQSITPSTLGFKVGEENLNIISFDEFKSICKAFGWKINKLGIRINYSENFNRMPLSHRDVFYQSVLLTKTISN
jgi:putative methyltransferase (TIGR04325 family)